MKGIVSILCSFEDEHYPSNSIDPWCLITKYPNEGICLFVDFGWGYTIPLHMSKCYGTQCISSILVEG
jgi:hypothetical protein